MGNGIREERKKKRAILSRPVTIILRLQNKKEEEEMELGWLVGYSVWLTAFNFFIGQIGAIAVAIAQFRPLDALGSASG